MVDTTNLLQHQFCIMCVCFCTLADTHASPMKGVGLLSSIGLGVFVSNSVCVSSAVKLPGRVEDSVYTF